MLTAVQLHFAVGVVGPYCSRGDLKRHSSCLLSCCLKHHDGNVLSALWRCLCPCVGQSPDIPNRGNLRGVMCAKTCAVTTVPKQHGEVCIAHADATPAVSTTVALPPLELLFRNQPLFQH